jgi:hypothetical protein
VREHADRVERLLDEHGPGEAAVSLFLNDDVYLRSCNHAPEAGHSAAARLALANGTPVVIPNVPGTNAATVEMTVGPQFSDRGRVGALFFLIDSSW